MAWPRRFEQRKHSTLLCGARYKYQPSRLPGLSFHQPGTRAAHLPQPNRPYPRMRSKCSADEKDLDALEGGPPCKPVHNNQLASQSCYQQQQANKPPLKPEAPFATAVPEEPSTTHSREPRWHSQLSEHKPGCRFPRDHERSREVD